MTTQINQAVTVTIPNPTPAQMIAISELLGASNEQEATSTRSTPRTKRAKTRETEPEETVNEEEEESFGTKELSEEDLDESEEFKEQNKEEEETSVRWDEVKAACNKFGNKSPNQMKAILLGFNIKKFSELEQRPKKWEAVYRRVMARLKK